MLDSTRAIVLSDSRMPLKSYLLCLFCTATVFAQTAPKPVDSTRLDTTLAGTAATANVAWHDVESWGLEGRAWPEQPRLRWYDRLPAAAEKTVTSNVWNLSRDSAGMMVRFQTDASAISVRYKLLKERLALPNMSAMGVSGVDLYARDAKGQWRWVAVSKPSETMIEAELVKGLAPGSREYALYLPLYNGVDKLEIGVPPGATFTGLAPRTAKPVVFYGTSITHGASASRPGMVHTAIIGRHLDTPVINLGFSGNGRMDAAVGEFLKQIDAAVFIIDCLPNMSPSQVLEKCGPLVKQLRAKHSTTPIVLVEDRRYTNSWIRPEQEKFHTANQAALKSVFEALKKEGVANLHYIPGNDLLGDDAEGAADGSHPSDLGFMRQAAVMEPIIRQALGK
jgi:hypothetical protein